MKEKAGIKRSGIIILLFLMLYCVPVVAKGQKLSVNAEEITLYGYYTGFNIDQQPAEYPKSFQLKVNTSDEVKYEVVYGRSATVSKTGLVKVKQGLYELYDENDELYRTEYNITPGLTIIKVSSGDQYVLVDVNVKDYSEIYVEEVIEKYISDNIKDDMSDYEKIEAIAQFPCQYEYDYDVGKDFGPTVSSGCAAFILYGSGTCIESTYSIIELSERIGLSAWERNGNKDPFAGGGHENAMVQDSEGNIYVVEAGYSSKEKPRPYDIRKVNSMFDYDCYDIEEHWYYDEEAEDDFFYETYKAGVKQYNGTEPLDVLEIPAVDEKGVEITVIGDKFSYGSKKVSSRVLLPDTIESIRFQAFFDYGLKEINIPDSVQNIDGSAFAKNSELTNIICSDTQPNYKVRKGVLYNKDMTELVSAPSVESITVPKSVKTIGAYSFYGNENLNSVIIQEGTETIEEYAFANCRLREITIPKTVKSIEEKAFDWCYPVIYGEAGTAAETYAKKHDLKFVNIAKKVSIKSINIEKKEYTVAAGATLMISYSILPKNNDGHYFWKSSDASVAVLDDRWICAYKPGKATLTCYACGNSSVYASCEVTVTKPVKMKSVTKEDNDITVIMNTANYVDTRSFEYLPENVTDKTLDWKSEDERIVRIVDRDNDPYYGYINGASVVYEAIRPGDVTLIGTAKDGGGAQVKLKVHVLVEAKDINKLTIDPIPAQAWMGRELYPYVVIHDGDKILSYDDITVEYENNENPGTAVVTIQGIGNYKGKVKKSFAIKKGALKYRAYVQKKGWMEWHNASDQKIGYLTFDYAGTTDNLRMETIQMKLSGVGGRVDYRAYVQGKGWTQWARTDKSTTYAGTKGESRRVEMIQLKASGQVANLYDLYYQAYTEHFGWLGWAGNCEKAGTAGYASKLCAFSVCLVPKGEYFDKGYRKCFYDKTKDGE